MEETKNELDPIGTLYGVPLYSNSDIPEGEIWFVMKYTNETWEDQEISVWKNLSV